MLGSLKRKERGRREVTMESGLGYRGTIIEEARGHPTRNVHRLSRLEKTGKWILPESPSEKNAALPAP